jgi:DNA-binding transcriptional MerR regulator
MGDIPPSQEELAAGQAGQPDIPDKLFFRIGEVSQLVGVEAYVLRYWESEFPGLSPRKSASGQRMFRRKDVELLLRIKHLLYSQKFTIEGARKALQEKNRASAVRNSTPFKQAELFGPSPLAEIRKQVVEILQLLGDAAWLL